LLTRNDAALKPYADAKQEYPAALERITALVADNPAQQQRLAKLAPLLDEKWRILNTAVVTMQTTGELRSVVVALPDASGRVAMDTIRAVLGQMRAEERELLSQRKAQYDNVQLAERLTNAALAKAHAHGVVGMRERAYELGADFHIGAGLGGRGTGVHVAMPLMADPGAATAA
jgi:CHASE3 domain sensor protein